VQAVRALPTHAQASSIPVYRCRTRAHSQGRSMEFLGRYQGAGSHARWRTSPASDAEPESSNPLIYRLQQASRCLHPSNQKPPLMPHKQVCSQIIIRHESLL
jgi:hypothetical protein